MTSPYAVYSIDELRDMLLYDPETGHLYWRVTVAPNRRKNTRADLEISTGGYRMVRLPGSVYGSAHRIAWALTTGYWPIPTVDHINEVRPDNRWDNLRVATMKQQMARRVLTPADFPAGPKSENMWGYSGVSKFKNGFRAECSRGGKLIRGPKRHTPKDAYDALVTKLAAL